MIFKNRVFQKFVILKIRDFFKIRDFSKGIKGKKLEKLTVLNMNTIGGIRTLEPKMEVLADCIQSVEESIRGTDACLQSYVDEQENLQDRVDVLAENLEKN